MPVPFIFFGHQLMLFFSFPDGLCREWCAVLFRLVIVCVPVSFSFVRPPLPPASLSSLFCVCDPVLPKIFPVVSYLSTPLQGLNV